MPSIINATTTNGLVTSADNSGELRLQTNSGTTAVTVTTAQLVGVGTTSPSAKLHVSQVGNPIAQFTRSDSGTGLVIASDSDGPYFRPETSSAIRFNNSANTAEYMRIDSSGRLLISTTATTPGYFNTSTGTQINSGAIFTSSTGGSAFANPTSGGGVLMSFGTQNNWNTGTISTNNSNTSYNTSSDYRLKENIAPMTNALSKVVALKPCTYTWKVDGSDGEGFIAHELQEICPNAVTGVKDAVETYTDEDGNEQTRIKPQGIDTSFLVATLTAAIQELNAKVDAQAAEIQALKGVA